MWIAFVIILSSVIASFSDWLFMDLLVHRFYAAEPAIWRGRGGRLRIVLSQIVGTVASAGVVVLCLWAPGRAVPVAGAAWLAGPLPGLNPVIAASHAAGWLVRLLIAALLASWFLAP